MGANPVDSQQSKGKYYPALQLGDTEDILEAIDNTH